MIFSSAFYLIDKQKDFTSFDIVKILRGKLRTKKIGHTGTLDPLATGALLIATGRYTKLIPYFEKDSKEYEFTINLDGESDSYDLGTEVKYISKEEQENTKKTITKEKLINVLKEKFIGEIYQVPPKYSALKIGGRKALHMIKEGENFKMKERKVNIYEIELLEYKYPAAKLRAKVGAGTYIRSIAHDLGQLLGTGAYVTDLRRTKVGKLDLQDAVIIENISREDAIDIKKLFKEKEFISLDREILKKINDGIIINGKFDFKKDVELFVINGEEITNMVIYDGERLIPKRRFE